MFVNNSFGVFMGITNRLSNFFISFDRTSDLIPLVSTFTNTVYLLQKISISLFTTDADSLKSRYIRHLNKKSASRCIVLLVPVLGNALIGVYDFLHAKTALIEERDAKGRTPLITAAMSGDLRVVQSLLNDGANTEAQDKWGYTALVWAADIGATDIVNALIRANANTEARDKNGLTALSWAAKKGNLETAQALLEAGADLEARDRKGATPLFYAAKQGHCNIIEKFLEKGAAIEARNEYGFSPLMSAALMKQEKAVKKLLKKGANLEARDIEGRTALILTLLTQKNHQESSITGLLKQKGADQDYAKEFIARKQLAHVWGIGGKSIYKANGEKRTFDLEGLTMCSAIGMLSRHVKTFFDTSILPNNETLSKDDQTEIQETIDGAFLTSSKIHPEKVLERIAQNKPVLILGGSKKHAISMVIYNNQLVICNRGEGRSRHAVKYYHLPADRINETLIQKLIQDHSSTRKFNQMVSGLKLKYLKGFKHKDQKVGNCTWAAGKTAFGVLCRFYASKKDSKIIYKAFTGHCRHEGLKAYLNTSVNSSQPLLQRVKRKATKKRRFEASQGPLKHVKNLSFIEKLSDWLLN